MPAMIRIVKKSNFQLVILHCQQRGASFVVVLFLLSVEAPTFAP